MHLAFLGGVHFSGARVLCGVHVLGECLCVVCVCVLCFCDLCVYMWFVCVVCAGVSCVCGVCM